MSQATAQNTLDLLILKTLARGSNHGFGITVHIQNASEGLLRIEEGRCIPPSTAWSAKKQSRASGKLPKTAGARATTSSAPPA